MTQIDLGMTESWGSWMREDFVVLHFISIDWIVVGEGVVIPSYFKTSCKRIQCGLLIT